MKRPIKSIKYSQSRYVPRIHFSCFRTDGSLRQTTTVGCVLLLATFLLGPSLTRAQSLNVPIVVQPAEWPGMATAAPTGTRTNAPVTFGIGIPDSAGIDCPGTQDKAQNEGAPTTLELTNGSGQLNAQFRCMAKWPSGNAEWVLVDTQLPSFAEGTPGYDTTISLVQVASGGGNFPASNMAQQCSGPGAPVAACPDANHIVVQTGAATFLIKQANYNLFDDVQVGPTHLVSSSGHGAFDGLLLLGPSHTQYALQNTDSVSCAPGPLPTNYRGSTICATPYASNLDSKSTCTIEENGPVRSALMCQGDMISAVGDVYMHWRTRMHFWANHSDTKVTIALRNADVPANCCTTPNYTNAYKEFTQFEARLTDNLGSPASRNFDFANHTAIPSSGTISTAGANQNAYLYQAYSQDGEWPHWTNAPNCTYEQDGCAVSPIPRTGIPGNWNYAANGYEINKNGGPIASGGNTEYPVGWADLDDGANGIETGVYQFSMYWPKSLEFQPGIANHNEIRIGIWPNQREFTSATSAVSYAMGWPQYSIHDTYWNFHAGTQTPAVAQNNFLYFQHYMLARPQTGTYYNAVKNATSGTGPLFYDIPDPVAEDHYYIGLGLCTTAPGQCVGDVGSPNFTWKPGSTYTGMKAFRYWGWPYAGGSDGTQFEQRNSFLRNWLQRGGAGTAGSVPGRYVWASHWYRMIVEKSLPRSDTPTTSGPGAGFRSLCTNVAECNSLSFFPWGDPKSNTLPSVWNGGMRNWGDDLNAMEHSVYWGAFTYYFLSGDEWTKEQLLQGFKDRYQNPFVSFNNLTAAAGGNNAPGHGHINAIRATGHWFSGAARMVEFLRSIGDPDADNATTVLTSPGASPSSATVLQGVEQNIAAQIALPYISSGYPKGWSETTLSDCKVVGLPPQLCSQGVSPVRGYVRSGGGGESCGSFGGRPPCDGFNHRADDSFQLGVWAEGVYDIWQVMRDVLGKDWHLQVGGVSDGAMGPLTVAVSEKNLSDMLYGSYQQMSESNCINTGSYSTSGCVYTQFSDFLNAAPGCTSSGDCLHSCITGCSGLTQWFALAAAAPTTNATLDLTGNPWQFLFESQLKRSSTLNMELGSHMMQFGVNYILADGSSNSNHYAVSSSVPVLTQVPIAVSPNPCVGPSTGTATCTISWTAPAGLSAVNNVTYRLKYWSCPSANAVTGTDCPTGGKTIVPTLKFHDDTLTAGFAAPDGTGSWEIDPSKNWNWAFTTDVPDCFSGRTAPNCNPNAPSGTSYTFNAQANSTYTFSLTAYVAGSTTTTNPPTVTITSPVQGAKLSGNVAVSASASSGIGVAGVQFEVDGGNLGTEVVTAPYSVIYNTAKSANGSHTLTAIVVDTAGNRASSSPVTVTVTNTVTTNPPTVTITSPSAGAKVSGSNVIISASASSDIGVAGVQFLIDGAAFGSKVTNTPYFVSWDSTKSKNGSHTLTAIVSDTAGNQATSNAVIVTDSNAINQSGPTVSLTTPTSGAKLSNTVTVSAIATSSIGIAGVQFLMDGVSLSPEIPASPYVFTWNTTKVSNGPHTLTATAFDTSGAQATSKVITVTVSNDKSTAPTVTLTAPISGAKLSNTVTVSAIAASSIGIAGVQFAMDGVSLGPEVVTSPYAIPVDTTKVSNGAHSLTATAFDTAGAQATSKVVAVTVSNNQNNVPTVSLTAPSSGVTVSGTINISANASDGTSVPSVQFVLDGKNLGGVILAPSYSMSWDTTKTGNGSHVLQAFATNAAGKTAVDSMIVTINNASGPAAPAVGSKTLTAIDTLTAFSVQNDDLAPAVTNCSGCQFRGQADLIVGQTTAVILRPNKSTPTADQVILQQGTLNGTVTGVSPHQFMLQVQGAPGPASILVIVSQGLTDYEEFSQGSSDVRVGQSVAVRGLLFKSGPQGGPTLVARHVALTSAKGSSSH